MDNSDKQMDMLLEEGGIADDGMDVDPVSGNEVPPGSMASEVRDDIPAQLSGGEYVVPADVLRFYGVKFFEDLRAEAKMGLAGMEANGRIGGEPVEGPAMGGGEELTPEEMAEIEGLMMAVGGYVPQTMQYNQPDPYMQQQAMYNQGAPAAMGNSGYAVGGSVPADTQVNTNYADRFAPGFTFMENNSSSSNRYDYDYDSTSSRTVTLYGPNGEVETVILPAQQARYDELLTLNYSETPVSTTTDTSVGQSDSDGSNSRDLNGNDITSTGTGTGLGFSMSQDTRDKLSNAVTKGLVGLTGPFGKIADIVTDDALSTTVDGIVDGIIDTIVGPVDKDTDSNTPPTTIEPTNIGTGSSTPSTTTDTSPSSSVTSTAISNQAAADEAMGAGGGYGSTSSSPTSGPDDGTRGGGSSSSGSSQSSGPDDGTRGGGSSSSGSSQSSGPDDGTRGGSTPNAQTSAGSMAGSKAGYFD